MLRYSARLFCLALVVEITACNFPVNFDPTGTSPTKMSAAATHPSDSSQVIVTRTQVSTSELKTATATTSTSAGQIPTSKVTLSPSQTLAPTLLCNRALPGSPIDITIPDDTIMAPGQAFSKTWRLQNAGSCTWTTGYAVIFFSGDSFGASRVNNFIGAVKPGQTVDISVDMLAPDSSGTFQGNWELSDLQGKLFGIGPDGNAPFWVRIVVVAPDTATPTQVATVTNTPTPAVYASGLSNLKPNDLIDLDTNSVNAKDKDDLLYTLGTDNSHHLIPQPGVRIGVFGALPPTFVNCSAITETTNPITLDTIGQGAYICYTTNIGLPGWVRLVALNAQDNTLTLEILTWAIP